MVSRIGSAYRRHVVRAPCWLKNRLEKPNRTQISNLPPTHILLALAAARRRGSSKARVIAHS